MAGWAPQPPARSALRWLAGAWTPWIWAAASLLAFLAAPFGAVALLTPLREAAPSLAQPSLPVGWALLAAGGVLVAARLCFGAWPRVFPETAILLGTGAVFAGATHGALHAWASYRYGYFDSDFVGPTGAFFAIVVAVAVAGFGAMIAPRGAGLPPMVAIAAGIGLTLLSLVGNLPGLADGLDPESVVPSWIIGGAVFYIILVGAVAARRLWAPADLDR